MADDVLITPASRKIEFKDSSNNIDAVIQTDASGNLQILNTGGDISIGDTTSDVYIGDGTNNIDIVFEQDGEIRGETGVTVTLGATGATTNLAGTVQLGGTELTATGAELNILDGVTATAAELNYTDGVTSAIQTQLDAKLPLSGGTISGDLAISGGDLEIGETSQGTWTKPLRALVTNLGNNQNAQFTFGKAASNNNLVEFSHHHVSDGSSSNWVSVGYYGGTNRLLMRTDGKVSVGTAYNSGVYTDAFNVTGNMSITGTVDGRDVASDGSKLDLIAASATANPNAIDNVVEDTTPQLGGNLDLNSNNITGTGNINITGTLQTSSNAIIGGNLTVNGTTTTVNTETINLADNNIVLNSNHTGTPTQNAGLTVERGSATDKVFQWNEINDYWEFDDKIRTEISGTSVEAFKINADLGTNENRPFTISTPSGDNGYSPYTINTGNALAFQTDGINALQIDATRNIYFYEDTGSTSKINWSPSSETLTFKDGVKAEFGDGADLRIQHSGTANTTYFDNYNGDLVITNQADNQDIVIQSDNGSGSIADYFRADGSTGETKIFYYGLQKLATKATGIDVTGTVITDGLTINDYSLPTADGNNGQVLTTDGAGNITFTDVSVSGYASEDFAIAMAVALG